MYFAMIWNRTAIKFEQWPLYIIRMLNTSLFSIKKSNIHSFVQILLYLTPVVRPYIHSCKWVQTQFFFILEKTKEVQFKFTCTARLKCLIFANTYFKWFVFMSSINSTEKRIPRRSRGRCGPPRQKIGVSPFTRDRCPRDRLTLAGSTRFSKHGHYLL